LRELEDARAAAAWEREPFIVAARCSKVWAGSIRNIGSWCTIEI
jgi:hypothetical protein